MENRPSIVNVINFIRGIEPREKTDLYEPVENQLELLERYRMKGMFLLQYDALTDPRFVEMLRGPPHEIGCWLKIVEPMCAAAGIPWRGRVPWDWHSDVGFSVGYLPEERERLADVLLEKFRELFGESPRSVGLWMIDAHTLAYLERRYGIAASCNCKDQWGVMHEKSCYIAL